jgi:hypothetical protein
VLCCCCCCCCCCCHRRCTALTLSLLTTASTWTTAGTTTSGLRATLRTQQAASQTLQRWALLSMLVLFGLLDCIMKFKNGHQPCNTITLQM